MCETPPYHPSTMCKASGLIPHDANRHGIGSIVKMQRGRIPIRGILRTWLDII